MSILERPAWQAKAACRGVGPGIFFLERGQSAAPALEFCATCPVRDECADHALTGETQGIWGGIPGQKALRRTRKALGLPSPKARTAIDLRSDL